MESLLIITKKPIHKNTDKERKLNYRKDVSSVVRLLMRFSRDPYIYEWLHTQYSDVCSQGDVQVNSIIRALDRCDYTYLLKYCKNERWSFLIRNYIKGDYIDSYLKGIDADPWWAS